MLLSGRCVFPVPISAPTLQNISHHKLLLLPHALSLELWSLSGFPSLHGVVFSVTIDGTIMRKGAGGYPPRRPPRAAALASPANTEDFSTFAALRHPVATQQPSMNDLEVVGRPAIIYESDDAAETADDGALMPWEGDADLLIDRFDFRHLLDSIRMRRLLMRARHGADDADVDEDVDENELDEERYRDLVAREEGTGRREEEGARGESQDDEDVVYGDAYGEQKTILMEVKHTCDKQESVSREPLLHVW